MSKWKPQFAEVYWMWLACYSCFYIVYLKVEESTIYQCHLCSVFVNGRVSMVFLCVLWQYLMMGLHVLGNTCFLCITPDERMCQNECSCYALIGHIRVTFALRVFGWHLHLECWKLYDAQKCQNCCSGWPGAEWHQGISCCNFVSITDMSHAVIFKNHRSTVALLMALLLWKWLDM